MPTSTAALESSYPRRRVSSTPRPFDSITDASEYWIARFRGSEYISDLILIPCKAAGLSWQAVESVLQNRPVKPKIDELTMKVAFKDYAKLLQTAGDAGGAIGDFGVSSLSQTADDAEEERLG